MDRRTLITVVLMALVIVVTPRLFPSARRQAPVTDTTARAALASHDSSAPSASAAASSPTVSAAPATAAPRTALATPSAAAAAATMATAPESTTVSTASATITVLNPGATPAAAKIDGYRDLRPGHHETVVVAPVRGPLLHFRLAEGRDTIALDTVRFAVQQIGTTTTFTAPTISVSYEAANSGYVTHVRASAPNAPAGSALLIDLPNEFHSVEADTLDDMRHFAYGYKLPHRDVASIPFSKLDSGVVRVDTGSMQWVNARNKYWMVALITPQAQQSPTFRGLVMVGGPRVARITRAASATTVAPLVNGQIAFDLYVGPQALSALQPLGNDLEEVSPYGGWLRPVVQPFATITLRVLLWMKNTFRLSYGWVLVLFGVLIRLILWPLYQRSMRTSIQMQRLQPELTEVQKRLKNDPEKQRDAIMKVYQAHGMSPLSPMLGCLPMLLPMPVLYALYFVCQNTIELRGVPFLWLPDLSLRDPYYIIPLIMGASMFVLSWIGMRAAPPNPQTKMMSYMMPVVFTFIFFNFASGLNLYYTVSNITSLPQQWWIARERAKAGVGPAAGMPPAKRASG